MLAAELQRAAFASSAVATSRGAEESRVIRFRVNGCDVAALEDTTRWVPETYVEWLVSNCREDVIHGRPICIQTSPYYFSRLLRRLSGLKEVRKRQGALPRRRLHRSRLSREQRRRAMDPPPFTTRRKYKPDGKGVEVCHISTPFPKEGDDISLTVTDTVTAIMEGIGIIWDSSKSYFDRLVVLLTVGKTLSGTPLVWPYIYHLFDSTTCTVGDMSLVQNDEMSEMLPRELDELYNSVDISPELQHLVKTNLRMKGYSCIFSDMKIDLNNYLHWRVARLADAGVRSLDDACTVRCLVVNM